MATPFANYLAGDKAALTKALQAYNSADDDAWRQVAVVRMAKIINRAPEKGFTKDQVISGRDLPPEVLGLIHGADAIAEAHTLPENGRAGRVPQVALRRPYRPLTDFRKSTDLAHASAAMVSDANNPMVRHPDQAASDDYLEPEGDDDELGKDDDRPIISRPADWTITSLREKWDAGLLDLQPAFQREYVWRLRPELPSRLIESILLEIPIPPLYFGRQPGGTLEVIDGQQRLTTLIRFVSNAFGLQRLARMPSLNGKTFRELSTEYQEKIKDTPIRIVEIDAGRNTNLRFEIFERLNRGSMTLNEQELRNCVYRGPFNVLLAELEKDDTWRAIKGSENPDPRFKEREMILRFFALANRIGFYTGALKRFLNEYMERYAPSDPAAIEEQAALFRQTMQNVLTVFGSNSGRLYSVADGACNGRWDTGFSIGVLEIQASALLRQDSARVQRIADQIREQFLLLVLANAEIRVAISQATNNVGPTRLRWTLFRSLIQPMLDDVLVEPRFFGYQLRKQLFDANPVCAICGNEILSFADSTVDHIIPHSRDGKTAIENGQLAHRYCNASKNASVG